MKKILSLVLALSVLLLALASCSNNNQTSSTGITIKPISSETTSNNQTTETTQTQPVKGDIYPVGDEFWAVTNTYSVKLLQYKSDKANACAITQYVVTDAKLEFPAVYTDSKGTPYAVIWIGQSTGVLKNSSLINEIVVPATVLSIKANAFSMCTTLETVKLNNGLETIEDQAFWCCTSLKNVVLPSTLLQIGDNAFIGTAIETLTIPSSVQEIGSKAFASCNNLTSVTLPRKFESQVADIFGKHASSIQFTFVD